MLYTELQAAFEQWEILKLVASSLDEMEEKFANTPRPFMYLIDRNGRFRPYPL